MRTPRLAKLAPVFALIVVWSTSYLPASAAESEVPCVDAEPERDAPVTDDDIIETLWVYSGAANPDQESEVGCLDVEDGTWVDVEISGVGDPDGSTSFDSPDKTCQIEGGECRVYPGSSEGGEQRIVVWVDSDDDNATIEADLDEGVDESREPGAQEPDTTDVVAWDWSTGRYYSVRSKIIISYVRRRGEFSGDLRAGHYECRADREVVLRKIRTGRDRVVGRDLSEYTGAWAVPAQGRGRFYARVERVVYDDDLNGSTTECLAARSETIRLR